MGSALAAPKDLTQSLKLHVTHGLRGYFRRIGSLLFPRSLRLLIRAGRVSGGFP